MSPVVELLLGPTTAGAAGQTLSLFYRPRRHDVARRWYEAVREAVEQAYPLRPPDRFHDFPGCHKDREWIAAALNHAIDTVNGHAPDTIPHRAAADVDQPRLNLLHVYFERLRGALLAPAAFFLAAPAAVQEALEAYNLLIHRFEATYRNERLLARGWRPASHAVLTFADPRPRYRLRAIDYLRFTRRVPFGALSLNYCELGKPLLDVYHDRDEAIGDDNIRPLRWLSADACLHFTETTRARDVVRDQVDLVRWWLGHGGGRLRRLGFWPFDPRNALGHLHVADLDRERGAVRGLNEDEIVALVGTRQRFVGVRVT